MNIEQVNIQCKNKILTEQYKDKVRLKSLTILRQSDKLS
jgi:hypothetical protein